jgi:hypothetical protein
MSFGVGPLLTRETGPTRNLKRNFRLFLDLAECVRAQSVSRQPTEADGPSLTAPAPCTAPVSTTMGLDGVVRSKGRRVEDIPVAKPVADKEPKADVVPLFEDDEG